MKLYFTLILFLLFDINLYAQQSSTTNEDYSFLHEKTCEIVDNNLEQLNNCSEQDVPNSITIYLSDDRIIINNAIYYKILNSTNDNGVRKYHVVEASGTSFYFFIKDNAIEIIDEARTLITRFY